jgi:hypothetical protein
MSDENPAAAPDDAMQVAGAVLACLHQMVTLLVVKGLLQPKEMFDALTLAQDAVPLSHTKAISIIEELGKHVTRLPKVAKE